MGLLGLTCLYLLVGALMDLLLEAFMARSGRRHTPWHTLGVVTLWLPLLVFHLARGSRG
jgi:hypothetical protein